jgi:unsaturated rhamnogalacturonyl hydrolase
MNPGKKEDYVGLAEKVMGMLVRNTDDESESNDHLTLNNWEWPTGVALYSMYKFQKRSGSEKFRDYLLGWYEERLPTMIPHKNVNTIAPMLALVCLYQEDPKPFWREKIEEWVSWITTEMPRTEYGGLQHMTVLNRHHQQLWDDTLFMAVLFLAKAGKVLGREELVQEAKYQFLVHIKYLQDKVTGLFYHGWTFDYRNNFAKAFWARGNSWFTAGAVDFIELCGNDDAVSRYVRSCLEDQVKELVKHQGENGLFTTLLDSEESYSETSATANIAYGILKGVRLGLLDGKFEATGRRAAQAVVGKIAEDGTVLGVSYGTGMGPDLDFYRKIPLRPTAYGQGLCFMMLSELL